MNDSMNPAKKRKAAVDPPAPPLSGNDDSSNVPLSANMSLADLDRLIDQRVADAVDAKILALTSQVDGLRSENKRLALRCESLEKTIRVLKKKNWTYSAPDIPWSYWIEQGHDEDYANNADRVVRSMKTSTQALRLTTSFQDVYIGTASAAATPILSDNVLNQRWEQLANAIQLSERIDTIFLFKVQLDKRTLQMIEVSLRQKGITKFVLDENNFSGHEGVQFATDVLKSNRTIGTFCWDDNPFRNKEDAYKLVDAILEHPTINTVEFVDSLNEDIAPLQRLFGGMGTGTLVKVDLSFNDIKTNGDRCIPDFLSTNPPLKTLLLKGNRLNDDDALHIALALQSNTNLRYLDLKSNELTNEGISAVYLLAIIGLSLSDDRSDTESFSDLTLNAVSGANHTCEIHGILGSENTMNDLDESIESASKMFMNDSIKSGKWNRGRKLFWVLVIRHPNASHIESELPERNMGFVPHVLACINTYSTYWRRSDFIANCNLSVLFELVRDWKTPEMYQFHQY